MALHSKLFSNEYTPFYEEEHYLPWQLALAHLQMTPWTPEVVLSGFNLDRSWSLPLSILQFKKNIMPHLSSSKYPSEHHPSTSSTFFVINTIRMKLLIIPSSYLVYGTTLHPHFHTHLISPNKCLPILYSEMSMTSSKLRMAFAVKFLEKRSTLGYPMIIAKVFESMLDSFKGDIKLKVSNNWNDGQAVRFMISSNV